MTGRWLLCQKIVVFNQSETFIDCKDFVIKKEKKKKKKKKPKTCSILVYRDTFLFSSLRHTFFPDRHQISKSQLRIVFSVCYQIIIVWFVLLC